VEGWVPNGGQLTWHPNPVAVAAPSIAGWRANTGCGLRRGSSFSDRTSSAARAQ